MKIHQKYIRRCIQISKKGLGTTRPNPMVGCVIVNGGVIIGEGYTSSYGGNHAEVNAINSVEDKSKLGEATLYVSLEPCSHFGKTPPCSNLIVSSGVKKVVVGAVDDNTLVGGKGIAYLEDNGVEVVVGVEQELCEEVNKRFFTFFNKRRPYVILKWAETRDGYIDKKRVDGESSQPTWISNSYSQQLVHKWRSEEHSILVGTNTVIRDNPKLNVRSWSGESPVRLVLDNSRRIPHNLSVFDGSIKTIVFTSSKVLFESEKDNVQLEFVDYSKSVPKQICDILYKHNIQSVIIEGGAQTLQSFINDGLWDEARIFIGDISFGSGLKSPVVEGKLECMMNVDQDLLKIMIPTV